MDPRAKFAKFAAAALAAAVAVDLEHRPHLHVDGPGVPDHLAAPPVVISTSTATYTGTFGRM